MRPAPIVLCAGQYGSASTWLYNAVHALMADRFGEDGVIRLFADTPDKLPPKVDPARVLVVKTHVTSIGLRWLAARGSGRVVLSLRDPRDAVASLASRFHFDYGLSSKQVAAASAILPLLPAELPCLTLRYEDRFTEDPSTLARLAEFLGLAPQAATLAHIFEALRPERVRAEIARLTESGVYGTTPTGTSYDPATQWHPGHVGDARIGKFAEILTPGQAGDVIRRTRAFQDAFGYPMPAPPALLEGGKAPLTRWGPGLAFLGAGFASPDVGGAVAEGTEARLHIPLGPATRRGAIRLRLDLSLPRRDAPRWSLMLAGQRRPLHRGDAPARHVEIDLPGRLAGTTVDLAFRDAPGLRLRGIARPAA